MITLQGSDIKQSHFLLMEF